MGQWLRICLAMQGTFVHSLVRGLRSHMPWSSWACMPQQGNLCATVKDPERCQEDPTGRNEDPVQPNKCLKKKKGFGEPERSDARPGLEEQTRVNWIVPRWTLC